MGDGATGSDGPSNTKFIVAIVILAILLCSSCMSSTWFYYKCPDKSQFSKFSSNSSEPTA